MTPEEQARRARILDLELSGAYAAPTSVDEAEKRILAAEDDDVIFALSEDLQRLKTKPAPIAPSKEVITVPQLEQRAVKAGISPEAQAEKERARIAKEEKQVLSPTAKGVEAEPESSIFDAFPVIGVAKPGETGLLAALKRQPLDASPDDPALEDVVGEKVVESPWAAALRALNVVPTGAAVAFEDALLVDVDAAGKPLPGMWNEAKSKAGKALYGESGVPKTPIIPVGMSGGMMAAPFQPVREGASFEERVRTGKALGNTYDRLVANEPTPEGWRDALRFAGDMGGATLPIGPGIALQGAGKVTEALRVAPTAAKVALGRAGVPTRFLNSKTKSASEVVENAAADAAKDAIPALRAVAADALGQGIKPGQWFADDILKSVDKPAISELYGSTWARVSEALVRDVQAGVKPAEAVQKAAGRFEQEAASVFGQVFPRSAPTLKSTIAGLEASIERLPTADKNSIYTAVNRTLAQIKGAAGKAQVDASVPAEMLDLVRETQLRAEALPFFIREALKVERAAGKSGEEALGAVLEDLKVPNEDLWEGLIGTAYEGGAFSEEAIVGALKKLQQSSPSLKKLLDAPPTPASVREVLAALDKAGPGFRGSKAIDTVEKLIGGGATQYILDEAVSLAKTRLNKEAAARAKELLGARGGLPLRKETVDRTIQQLADVADQIKNDPNMNPSMAGALAGRSKGMWAALGLPGDVSPGVVRSFTTAGGMTVPYRADNELLKLITSADGMAKTVAAVDAIPRITKGGSIFPAMVENWQAAAGAAGERLAAGAFARAYRGAVGGFGPIPNVIGLPRAYMGNLWRAAMNSGAETVLGGRAAPPLTPAQLDEARKLGVTVTRMDEATKGILAAQMAKQVEGTGLRWTAADLPSWSRLIDDHERGIRLKVYAAALSEGKTALQAAEEANRALPRAAFGSLTGVLERGIPGNLGRLASATSANFEDSIKAFVNNPGAFAKWARVNTDPVVDAVSEELGITDSKRKQAIREIADGMDTPSAFHLAQLVGIGAFLRSRDLSDLQLEKVSELGAQAAGFISDIFGADVSQEDMRKMSDQEIVEGVIRASGRYRDVGDFVTPIQIARSFGYEPVVGPAGVYVEADPGDFGALAIPMMAGKDGTPAYVKVRMTPAARNKIRVAKKAAQGLGAEALISALKIANDLAPPEVSPIVPAFKPSQAKAPLIAPIVEGEAQ